MHDWKPRLRYHHPYLADVEEERRMVAFMVQHPRRFLTRVGTFSPDIVHYTFQVPFRRAATLARRASVIYERTGLRQQSPAPPQAATTGTPAPQTPTAPVVAPPASQELPRAVAGYPRDCSSRFLRQLG